uniref:Uncharacterized protein n=1 Tax=Arundo donax TaxID=35708 RepID=A0A0A9DBZ3_ARUDO
MHEPSVTSNVGNMSKPSAKQSFKIIFIPVWTSILSCTDRSPEHFPYALSNIIHHRPESTGATRPIAASPKSGSKTSSVASSSPSSGIVRTLKLAGIKP